VPDFLGVERIVFVKKLREPFYLLAAFRAERSLGIFGGIDGMRVANQVKPHSKPKLCAPSAKPSRRSVKLR